MPALRTVAALLAGGFVGTVLRALLADAWVHDPTAWPWSTFVVNVAGALLLGIVVAVLRSRPAASLSWRPLLGTGLCGGLTTFSALQLELVAMAEGGAAGRAAAYLAASLVLGLAMVVAGLRIGATVPAPVGIEIPVGASAGASLGIGDPVDAARGDGADVERSHG